MSAMAGRWLWLSLALGAMAAGCVGEIGDGPVEGEKPKTTSGSLTCDPNLDPSGSPLIRLSRLQYENTLRDLLGDAVVDDATVSTELAQFPTDGEAEDSFAQMDERVSQRHVDTYYGVADAAATLVSNDSAVLTQLAGDCAASPDAACIEEFVRNFGRRVFRRPLTEEEVARHLELDEGDATETFRSLVFVMLMSPQLNYHLEIDGAAIDDREDYLRLSGYELASKLSFHFWQSMPDDALFAAAEDGSLVTEQGFAAQVERLFEHERTRETVRRFYAEWYRLDSFAGFATTPAFSAFADGIPADEALYDAMREEIEALTSHYTWDVDGGSYNDMLTTSDMFTDAPALLDLYGDAPRSGLLTRAAFLVSTNERTNPFKRGSYVRQEILCDELAQPDPNQLPPDALQEPEIDPEMSTRERFAAKTSPAECQACHAQFNPLGFALEAYDGLGRYRTTEDIFADDGSILASVPVDTAVSVRVGDERVDVEGPEELMTEIAESGKPETCFARHYFRYTYRRHENDQVDGCSMVAVREALLNGGGLRSALKAIALEPAFRVRVIADEEVQP